jgi:hypothetical protein
MKKSIYIGVLLAGMAALHGCDVIDAPYKETNVNPIDTTRHIRKILLEDYTGAKCPNCPAAADIAKQLEETFKGRIYTMSIHAGYYAKPDPIAPFDYDFRNEAGNDLVTFFKIPQFPNGMANRVIPAGGSDRVLEAGEWGAAVAGLLDLDADLSIALTNTYATATRTLTVDVALEYFNAQEADNYLSVYVIEDSIIKPQIDNRLPVDQQKVLDYVHNHVLRGAVNGKWWGERLSTEAIAPGTKLNRQYTITLNPGWNASNCKILAYVHKYDQTYDPVTTTGRGLEILQVEEKEIGE